MCRTLCMDSHDIVSFLVALMLFLMGYPIRATRVLTTKPPPSEKTRIEHFQNIEKLGNPGRRNFLWILEKNKTPPEANFFEKQ